MNAPAALAVALIAWVGFTYPALVQENDDVIVGHFEWIVQRHRLSLIQKSQNEATTPQGKALLTAVAHYLGINPRITSIGLAALEVKNPPSSVGDSEGLIQSPVGYTICYSRPTTFMGAKQSGINTYGDATFNAAIVRAIPGYKFDGLAWYISISPNGAFDNRVVASFDVVMVKLVPGWQSHYKNCEPTGEHPWISKNSLTQLNVPCSPTSDGPWCPRQ